MGVGTGAATAHGERFSPWLDSVALVRGVRRLPGACGHSAFAELYSEVRSKEGRLYPDEVVAHLPRIDRSHPHAREWAMRAGSARRLLRHIGRMETPATVLDLGCGCGWLTAAMAALPGVEAVGMDVVERELEQAARVFSGTPGLSFVQGDVMADELPISSLDAVVMAATVQYFPDLGALVRRVLELLAPGGQVHILDSPLYEASELDAARARTVEHYRGLDLPGMALCYHHHSVDELRPFGPKFLHDPDTIPNRFVGAIARGRTTPFPWVVIRT